MSNALPLKLFTHLFACNVAISQILNCIPASECSLATKFIVSGQKYCAGDVLPISVNEYEHFVFGNLVGALITPNCLPLDLLLLFEPMETIDGPHHKHCFYVKSSRGNEYVMKLSDLLDLLGLPMQFIRYYIQNFAE